MEYKLTKLKLDKNRGILFLKTCFSVYKTQLFIMLFFLAITALADAGIPKLIEHLINTYIAKSNYSGLINFSLFVFLAVIIATICQYFQVRMSGKLSQQVLFDIRRRLFRKLQNLPISFYSQNQSGEIIQRITKNVADVDRFFQQGFTRLMNIIFSLLSVFVFLFLTSWQIALICLFGVILVLLFLIFQGKFSID